MLKQIGNAVFGGGMTLVLLYILAYAGMLLLDQPDIFWPFYILAGGN